MAWIWPETWLRNNPQPCGYMQMCPSKIKSTEDFATTGVSIHGVPPTWWFQQKKRHGFRLQPFTDSVYLMMKNYVTHLYLPFDPNTLALNGSERTDFTLGFENKSPIGRLG